MSLQTGPVESQESEVIVRRATPGDALAIHEVAQMLSRANQESESGATASTLSARGFLLYPLAADSHDKPNYAERIRGSRHFWVAMLGAETVGFLMAYTFAEYQGFANLNENDLATLSFFTSTMGVRDSAIYLAQIGVKVNRRHLGVAFNLLTCAFGGMDGARHPAAFAEIAQRPLWNAASSRAAIRNGFVPLFLREKDVHKPAGERRLSATFVKTFPWAGRVEAATCR